MLKTISALALVAAAMLSPTVADDSMSVRSEAIERRLEAAEYMATMSSTPQCTIESGFDFVGEDLTNVPGKDAMDCCAKCANTAECKAYSWSAYNFGTCWLKRGRGQVIVNPNVHSALMIPGVRASCETRNTETEIVGNDIGNVTDVGDNGECCRLCRLTTGCRAYTYTSDNGGTCWFKSGRGKTIVKKGYLSADVYPAVSFQDWLVNATESDVEYLASNITSKASATADGCFPLCRTTEFCSAFTWTNDNGGTCWLKHVKDATARKAGVISGVIETILVPGVLQYPNEAYVDYVLSNSSDPADTYCAYMCRNFVDGCKVVTWTSANGGTCWYRSGVGRKIPMPGAYSRNVNL